MKLDKIKVTTIRDNLANYKATLDCFSPEGDRILIRTAKGHAIWLSTAATILDIIPDYVMEV